MTSPPHRLSMAMLSRARRYRTAYTDIGLVWLEGRLEHSIRFGRAAQEQVLTPETRLHSFRADAIVAFVRWSANDYGTINSRIDILRAVRPGEPYSTIPFVQPGGEILLSIRTWPKVRQVFDIIDTIEAAGLDPCDVAPDHWRHVHNRISVGARPRAYTVERHDAWLRRRAIEQ